MSTNKTPVSDTGGATSGSAPQSILESNLEAFVAFARERGAAVDENGAVVYQGVTLTHHIQWVIEGAWGDETPVNPEDIWRELIFDHNVYSWWKYCHTMGAYFDEDGWLVFGGKRLPVSGPEYLQQHPAAFERLLTEKEMQALWENLLSHNAEQREE